MATLELLVLVSGGSEEGGCSKNWVKVLQTKPIVLQVCLAAVMAAS